MHSVSLLPRLTLSANALKFFAVVVMVFDHCATVFLPLNTPISLWIHAFGQLAAPVMCFFIAEGYWHTTNLRRYLGRLLLAALLSHIPYTLCFNFCPLRVWTATSIMWSLFLGLLALTLWRQLQNAALRVLVTLCCSLLAYSANWNYIAVLWILAFGLFRSHPVEKWLAFSAVSLLYGFQYFLHGSLTPLWIRPFVLLALPILQLYGGNLGRKSKALQWGYYLFYPLHFIVLYLLKMFFP